MGIEKFEIIFPFFSFPILYNVQAEPYLHSGMGQVSFYQEALKIFFRGGLILNDKKILDPWVYSLYNTGFL